MSSNYYFFLSPGRPHKGKAVLLVWEAPLQHGADEAYAGSHLRVASPALGLILSGGGGRKGLPWMSWHLLEQQCWQLGYPELVAC